MPSQQTALVLVADGSEEMEAVTAIDVLRRAGIVVTVACVRSPLPANNLSDPLIVECSRGVLLRADCAFTDAIAETLYDVLLLPGGMKGAQTFETSQLVQHCIRRHEQAQKHVAFICAAPIALVSSGAFRTPSPHVTSHPSVGDRVRPAFPLYRDDQAVVVSAGGRLITSRGPGTALEFALAVVREVCGEAVAEKVAAPMCIGK